MGDPDFPNELRALIRNCIPDIDAVELLLLLSRHPRKEFSIPDLMAASRAELTQGVIRSYLTPFHACRLIAEKRGRYCFAPDARQLRDLVRALEKLYNERPVTLVRTIYALRNEPVRAFSDAFRFRS